MLKELTLTIFLIKNSFGMSYEAQLDIAKKAVTIINQEAKLNIKINKIIRFRDKFPKLRGINKRSSRFYRWITFIINKNKFSPSSMHLLLEGPIIESPSVRYIAGLGQNCKPLGGFAISQIQPSNPLGQDRHQQSLIVVIHEIAHMIGARTLYKDSTGYQNIQAAALTPLPIKFDDLSLIQIKRCLK